MLPIAITSSGAVSTTPIQKRRVISRSSGFSSVVAVTVRGSSAIPQIGHEPGSDRTISGCIGHVYSVRVVGSGLSGSSAIPHDGHGTGLGSRTSGHIGQTYIGPGALALGPRTSGAGAAGGLGFVGPPNTTSLEGGMAAGIPSVTRPDAALLAYDCGWEMNLS